VRCAGPTGPRQEVDPTGAGDVFAAGFLIGLAESRDPLTAARFAVATASMSVAGVGMTAIPTRPQVDEWLSRHG
jgi:1D-myo-inositol 3-kinase